MENSSGSLDYMDDHLLRGSMSPRGSFSLPQDETATQPGDPLSPASNKRLQKVERKCEKLRDELKRRDKEDVAMRRRMDQLELCIQHLTKELSGLKMVLDCSVKWEEDVEALWQKSEEKGTDGEFVPLDDLIGVLMGVSKTQDYSQRGIVLKGLNHFFGRLAEKHSTSEPSVSHDDWVKFLELFGPLNGCLERVLHVYKEGFFHGFISKEDAASKLQSKPPGFYLFRYSSKCGCFAFEVKKVDSVESYAVKYNPDLRTFLFRNKAYPTLTDFFGDPDYASVFKKPLFEQPKSKYLNDDRTKTRYNEPTDNMAPVMKDKLSTSPQTQHQKHDEDDELVYNNVSSPHH